MKAKRVLITGLNGFTGYYVSKEFLDNGYNVFGIGSGHSELPNYQKVNLLNKPALSEIISEISPDIVIHLAAVAFVGHGQPEEFYQINLIGTRNLLEVVAGQKKIPESVLLASSANVYGNTTEGKLNELTNLNPVNDYAVSKLSMEYVAKLWMNQLPIIITRPFNYTGVGQSVDFLIPKIVSFYKNKASSIELGNLNIWRDFGDVRAIALAYRRLVEVNAIGKTVNISSGNLYSLKDVLKMAENISQHSLEVKVNPAFVRSNEVLKLCGDNSLLKSLVDDFNMPPLEHTLTWMFRN